MSEAITTLIPVFCIATMFAMGLDVTLDDIVAPFRNRLALAIIILVNNILVPLLGLVIIIMPAMLVGTLFAGLAKQLVSLSDGQQVGFLLLILAPGSILAPVLATLAGAKLPFAKGTMILLVGASVILLPVELTLLCQFPGMECNTINAGSIFVILLLYQLLPLALGILINGRYGVIAKRLRPLIVQLSSLTFLAILALLVTSGQLVSAMPGTSPIVRTGEFSSNVLTSMNEGTATLDTETVPDGELSSEFNKHNATLPKKPAVKVLAWGNKWMIVNTDTSYIITRGKLTRSVSSSETPALVISKVNSEDPIVTFSSADTNVFDNLVKELNSRHISSALLDEFRQKPNISVGFNLVVVVQQDQAWALVNSNDTYFIEYNKPKFTVYRETAQPIEVVAEYLKSLAMLKAIGPAIDFLTQSVSTLLPYAMFIALAVILMTIGYYSGVAVRNVVGITDADIPRTLAISATVRNVSVALIVAYLYASSAVTVVLVFYTISLIVAAIQATKWAGQPDTAPVAPAIPSQAAVIAPERGATSTL